MGHSSQDVRALVSRELESGVAFQNFHGLTAANVRSFVVAVPFQVTVDPDDDEEM